MSKLKEYITLSRDVRRARRKLLWARDRITGWHQEYFLDSNRANYSAKCINRFDCVKGNELSTNALDDTGFVTYCDLLNDAPCTNAKCPCYAKHLDYIVAIEKFNVARDARRAFVKNLFRGRSK